MEAVFHWKRLRSRLAASPLVLTANHKFVVVSPSSRRIGLPIASGTNTVSS
jgi:hypothetical protein